MNPYHAIGSRIAEEREKHNLTQRELAAQLNISYQCLSGWERGTRKTNLDDLCKLADIFGVTCDYLIRGYSAQNVAIGLASGLSDKALEHLHMMKAANPDGNHFLNYLICHPSITLAASSVKRAVAHRIEAVKESDSEKKTYFSHLEIYEMYEHKAAQSLGFITSEYIDYLTERISEQQEKG